MKNLTLKTAILTLMASPAFAHDGIHLHPHGFEVATLFGLVVLATYLVWKNR